MKDNRLIVMIFLMLAICCGWLSYANNMSNKLDIMTNNLDIAESNLVALDDELNNQIEKYETLVSDLTSEEYEFVYIGDYHISHYCVGLYEHICGTGSGITATGTEVTAGRSVAVDPSVIPYGTKMYIEGYGMRIAEDCGGAVNGKHIDVAVETHDQAMNMGIRNAGIWILVKVS